MSSNLPSLLTIEKHLTVFEESIKACQTLIEQTHLHTQLKTYQAAAEIYKRKDLASEFSLLIRKCEFMIAKSNPPVPPKDRNPTGTSEKSMLPQGNILSSKVLSSIRKVH